MKIKAAIFDLDNTLTNAHWRSHLAESKQWDAFFEACDGDTEHNVAMFESHGIPSTLVKI